MKKITYLTLAGAMSMLMFTACQKEQDLNTGAPSPGTTATGTSNRWFGNSNMTFYALSGSQLDKFKASRPQSPISTATITGLQSGENILAIDFRPATGQMYGLGSTSRIYVINPLTGAARMIGAGPFSPAISGTVAGFDFNPTVDRIRLVTSSGQNLRLNPETGAVAFTDGMINGQAGAMISGVAYTNNQAGQTTTSLYDIDPASDKLYIQTPPNDGTLSLVGALNIDIDGDGGFDISPENEGLAIYKVNNVSTLFSVSTVTGEADVMATYPNISYTALAIPTASVAYALNTTNSLLIFEINGFIFGGNNNNIITKPITGLPAGVGLVGLDMRPLNGQIYALGNNGSIYTINSASGAAALAGTLSTPLSGTSFGFDFNPVVDRIRIVTNGGQNFRFNPNDGTTIVDLPLNPGTPGISAAAYSNNFAGTTTTTLFAIDSNNDKLYQINPPNNGTLVLVGNLGANAAGVNAFDIGGTSGNAYAVFKTGFTTKIYRINTTSGNAFPVRFLGNNDVIGFTIGLGF